MVTLYNIIYRCIFVSIIIFTSAYQLNAEDINTTPTITGSNIIAEEKTDSNPVDNNVDVNNAEQENTDNNSVDNKADVKNAEQEDTTLNLLNKSDTYTTQIQNKDNNIYVVRLFLSTISMILNQNINSIVLQRADIAPSISVYNQRYEDWVKLYTEDKYNAQKMCISAYNVLLFHPNFLDIRNYILGEINNKEVASELSAVDICQSLGKGKYYIQNVLVDNIDNTKQEFILILYKQLLYVREFINKQK